MSSAVLGTGKLDADSTYLYQAGFDAARWSGKLGKFAVTIEGEGSIRVAAFPAWDAADILTGRIGKLSFPLPENRQIYTANAVTASGLVEFKWDILTSAQKAKLDASPKDGAGDGLGARRVDFLRGARSDEIGRPLGIFRMRDTVLGDIVNSNLVHVGAPAVDGAGAEYRLYYEEHKNRAKALYVGANDGMLHAFNAMDGVELFAYIPQALLGGLPQLSRADYQHRPYVDGTIAVAEAQVQKRWKTLLAAGMGGGAQGVFALDVSDPADFKSGAGALWEFTDSDDADMGNVLNLPSIARFRTRMVAGVPEYRYFVVVGSGLNNYLEDGHANPLAPAVLFLLSVDKKASEPWRLGVNYFKFKKPILDASLPNGLGSPALVMGEDGAVRFVYAGDLQGNLWRFDFTGSVPWVKENSGTTPLFTALDERAHRQPVTTQPRVVFAPGGGYVVLFGTGKFVEESDVDPAGFATQSFYGIYDSLQKSYAVTGRSQLEQRALAKAGDVLQVTGKEFVYGDSAGKKRGWYFDFLASDKTGERSISNPLVESGRLLFNSLIPCAAPCPDGGGRSYVLDALSGLPVGKNTSGMLSQLGMLTAPALLQTSASGNHRNALGKSVARRQSVVIHAGAGGAKGSLAVGQGDAESGAVEVALPAMRFSWREIPNWQELRLGAGKK
jgi:type IV pilus assembly protein PilY1